MDDMDMKKAGRSAAFKEILDLLTRMEMEDHAPKSAPPEMPALSDEPVSDDVGMEAAEQMGGAEGELTPEELAELEAKMKE